MYLSPWFYGKKVYIRDIFFPFGKLFQWCVLCIKWISRFNRWGKNLLIQHESHLRNSKSFNTQWTWCYLQISPNIASPKWPPNTVSNCRLQAFVKASIRCLFLGLANKDFVESKCKYEKISASKRKFMDVQPGW